LLCSDVVVGLLQSPGVCNSTTESFSIVTMDTKAAHVPIVVSRSGGPEEIVTDSQTGEMLPLADATALANAIEILVVAPDRGKYQRWTPVAGQG